jgi:hypothetical protein
LFFDQSSSALFVVLQADNTSGLLNDYAVYTIELARPRLCNATFSTATANVPPSGFLATVMINADADCTFSAVTDTPWIQLVSGNYGSGQTELTYLVRPNLTQASRSGTISMGNAVLTIQQDGAVSSSSMNALSFKPVATDYSKTLDKLIFASSNPNELHIYDPATRNEQFVPLPRAPLSLSVEPNGLYAAVGHDGWISLLHKSADRVCRESV